jgi:DNA-directed RNA polymerase beta subunit
MNKNLVLISQWKRYYIVKYLIELINAKQILMILITYQTVVRTVGEQLSQQFGVGLAMARTIRERMNVRDNEVFTPIDLINAKTLSSVINSFFGTNQCLSLWIKRIHLPRYAQEDYLR